MECDDSRARNSTTTALDSGTRCPTWRLLGGFFVRRLPLWSQSTDYKLIAWYNSFRSNFGIEIMNGCIYIAGGFDGTRTTSTVERFDMRAYKWEVGIC